ncbi:PilZ domain-containing protein [Sphingomonas sp.]|uniref:PilZ domain-containing protein n=1 Tax=Sphingomonas sp. TaxID=28214 RepID=UPI0025E6A695|nr:PilZ domain-containing protein [Sphingomonas sp.]
MINVAPVIPSHNDGRKQQRTHLFVTATLYSEAGSVPVRVRNMSPSGALIECAEIPEPGARAVLKRGSLQASGQIAWSLDGKGGIAFENETFVTDWMSRPPAAHQQRIDRAVNDFRSCSGAGADSADDDQLASGSRSTVEELFALRAELSELGTSLVDDLIMVAMHPEIQILDISIQRIDRIIIKLARSAARD